MPPRTPFRLSLQLADFAASDLFEPSSTTHQQELAAWLVKTPRATHGAAQIPAAAVFHAISAASAAAAPPSPQQASQLHKITAALSATARTAAGALAGATGAAALAPADEAAATQQLRLSFFFFTHLIKLTGTWADARGAAFKPSTAAWQLRSVAFGALSATQAVCGEARAAALLALHAALDVVGHPLPAHDADAKSAAEICRRAVCDFLAAAVSPRAGQSEAAAAGAADALLSLLEQPKVAEGVVKEVQRVVAAVMSRSALAGCSLVGLAARRAGANASGADALAALLAALAGTSSVEGPALRATLMAHAPEVIALLTQPRPAVRKAALDVAGALGAAATATSWCRLHFAAAVRGLNDDDATLRAKALGALEAGAERAVSGVWSPSSGGQQPEVLGITPEFFASSLAARLTDRSVTVRKKAAAAVAALSAAEPAPPPFLAQSLQRYVVPVLAKLLQQPHDGKLYPGEAGAALLSDALTALAAAASQDAGGVLHLLALWRHSQDEAARSNIGAAIAKACLALPADGQRSTPLLHNVLRLCGKQGVHDLRGILHQDHRAQAVLEHTAERAADTATEGLLPLCRAVYVLVDGSPGEEAAGQLQWLLGVARSIAGSTEVAGPDGAEALHWCLEAAGVCHTAPGDGPCVAALARELALTPGVAPEEVLSAVALLRQLPSPKEAMFALLRELAQAAGIHGDGLQGPTPPGEERGAAAASFLTVLSALADTCSEEKARFLDNIRAESAAAAAEGGPAEYLAEEGDAKAQEAAAQKFLDDLLAAEDSTPASFVPAALELAGSPLAGPLERAEALRLLWSLARLSQPLAERCLPVVMPLLDLTAHGAPLVALAAVRFARAAVTAHPASCSRLLSRFAPLLSSAQTDAVHQNTPSFVAREAAEALAALLHSGRLRVHDWVGLAALGLVHPDQGVASQLRATMVGVLDAAGAAGERAAAVLAVVQQAPPGAREAAADAAAGLLRAGDLQADGFVVPCLTAALAAAAGRGDDEQARAAAALLRPLRPSFKALRLLAAGLESTATAPLPPAIAQELQHFVRRAVVAATTGAAAAEEEGGRPPGERKRGREGKSTAVTLQAQLLGTLAARAAPRPRRHPR